MKPEHTACTSKAAPRVMPSGACTLVAVAGKVWSGVAVARTIRSRSRRLMPARSSARCGGLTRQIRGQLAVGGDVALADAGALRIHSSEVSSRLASSSLVTTRSGR